MQHPLDITSQDKSPLDAFLSIAHWLPRAISPFMDLDVVLDIGIGDSDDEYAFFTLPLLCSLIL